MRDLWANQMSLLIALVVAYMALVLLMATGSAVVLQETAPALLT